MADLSHVETLGEKGGHGDLEAVHTHIQPSEIDSLTPEHREWLLQRYGTLELDPVPDMNPADPLNWPHSRKVINIVLVSFTSMTATFTAAAIQSAFELIAADFSVSVTKASYLVSLFIAILGGAPLFWRPLSERYGRRPIFLISLICSMAGNIGCAKSPSYATMALCRAITAFFISPAAAIGTAVVAECFQKRDRAKYIGIWTLMVTLGVPLSPFIFGFLAERVSYRYIYWTLAALNGVQFILHILLNPESRYLRGGVVHTGSSLKQEYFTFKRLDPRPLTIWDFLHPLTFAVKPCVLLPSIAYAMVFVFASVLASVEIPQLFGEKFHFGAQSLGLQFIGLIVGSVIGEQLGGWASDSWMNRRQKKINARPDPEYRLWLGHFGFLLTIVGVVVFLVQIERLQKYNVTPIIGAAISAVGNQLVTTTMITYAVDCYRIEAASVGVFVTFVRQMWGFIGPFWFPPMFTNVGLYGSAGIAAGLIFGCSVLPVVFLQWKGKALR